MSNDVKLDREIELLNNQAVRAQTPYMEADRNSKAEYVKKLEGKLATLVDERKKIEDDFKLKINRSGLDELQAKTLKN